MSHVITCEIEWLDSDSLAKACMELGLQYVPTATQWKWWGTWQDDYDERDAAYQNSIPVERYGTADAGVITIPGVKYQIGVYRHPTKPGALIPVWDSYGTGAVADGSMIEQKLGKGLTLLRQGYAEQVTRKHLVRQGFRVTKQTMPGGQIRLLASR